MSAGLIFGYEPTEIIVSLTESLTFDAAVSTDHSHSATVTQHPVETGSTISDHTVLNPMTLRIEGIFSETPMPSQLLKKSASTPSADLIESAKDQWNQLEAILEKREPVDVKTHLKEYETFVITAINNRQTAESGDSIFVFIDLVKVNIVDSETTDVPGVSEESKGTQSTTEASDTKAASGKALTVS